MKPLKREHVGLMIVAIVAISITGTYSMTSYLAPISTEPTSSAFGMGHVEVIVRDADDNIKAYRQSDNHIVLDGMGIIATQAFSTAANFSTGGRVKAIEIGNDNTAPAFNQLNLISPIGGGCTRQAVIFANETAHENTGNAEIFINGSATFSGATCSDASIDEAGAFTATSGGLMFARNTFTSVNLQPSDTLQLNWDFIFLDT